VLIPATLPSVTEGTPTQMTTIIDPVIVAKDIRKKYGDITAVDGISFEVRRGEVFGMLGPNHYRRDSRRHA
jgi:ABC-type polysaccharide/polyol phosphate transport system ATPase subunit